MTDDDLFRNAVSLVPDSFFADIENDAREQGFQSVMLTTAGTGLRAQTINRILEHFADRDGDPGWEALGPGQQLDEVFPQYHGIGWPELLTELGLTTMYVLAAPEPVGPQTHSEHR
jgi:hypothetical protein